MTSTRSMVSHTLRLIRFGTSDNPLTVEQTNGGPSLPPLVAPVPTLCLNYGTTNKGSALSYYGYRHLRNKTSIKGENKCFQFVSLSQTVNFTPISLIVIERLGASVNASGILLKLKRFRILSLTNS